MSLTWLVQMHGVLLSQRNSWHRHRWAEMLVPGGSATSPAAMPRTCMKLHGRHLFVVVPVLQGSTGPSEVWGQPPCQGSDAEGACPLLLCNVVHYVLVNS